MGWVILPRQDGTYSRSERASPGAPALEFALKELSSTPGAPGPEFAPTKLRSALGAPAPEFALTKLRTSPGAPELPSVMRKFGVGLWGGLLGWV